MTKLHTFLKQINKNCLKHKTIMLQVEFEYLFKMEKLNLAQLKLRLTKEGDKNIHKPNIENRIYLFEGGWKSWRF